MTHGYLKDQNYSAPFDVVIAVEVIEHLTEPWKELHEIENVLAPDGIVIFSTLLTNAFVDRLDASEHFKNWWYKDDPTHVSFFCNRVLAKMADMNNYDIDIFDDKVFVLKKTPPAK
jgi:2-polyprenyl-3-methyl-5-hydroxy-6-metoxy-1,4-benzoquinol methylase